LALTAANREEAAALLERLIAPGAAPDGDPSHLYGLIRYSRLLDAPRAVPLLETNSGNAGASVAALLDLEILRRRTELAGTGRLVAETWLLLGRYPEMEQLYRWAAWFFDYQRHYGETAALLKTATRHQFTGQWITLHEALRLLREGDLDAAESAFAAIPAEAARWPQAANRGRIREARREPAPALEWYEIAAAALQEQNALGSALPMGMEDWDPSGAAHARETASRIQFRIAQCLKTLGRPGESRRALEYALDLNPGNHSARLELGRLGN
jgi:tetratricopeptide (TPR) repeat protein